MSLCMIVLHFIASIVKAEPEKTSDPRVWDPVCLKNVASKITECYKENYYKLPKRSPSNPNKEIIVVSLIVIFSFCV